MIPAMPVIRVIAALAGLAGPSLACPSTFTPAQIDGNPGATTAIAHWQIQSSANAALKFRLMVIQPKDGIR
jgi:exo-1,4-beta-D-glucosaminidase